MFLILILNDDNEVGTAAKLHPIKQPYEGELDLEN